MMEQDRTTTDSGATRGGLLVAAGVYALLTALMFGDVLVSPRQVLSSRDNDLYLQFVPWREFAFGQLAKGNLPLWNPHLFCGAPFLGAPQSALLYPPNWLHLVLPVGPAINWLIAMHIFWAGLTMYLWTRHRRLHGLACLAAGGVFMFSAVQFLHIVAGHLANLYLMPWVPLLFLAIDGVFDTRAWKYCLLGMLALSMMILAGHPQYLYYTGITAGVYCLLRLLAGGQKVRVLAGLALIVAGAAALTAVQVLETIHASAESIRGRPLPYWFAGAFSLPPENFLTLIAPGFFGDDVHLPYWGRCYLWEVSMFFGAGSLVLAVYGAVAGDRKVRRYSLPMALIALVLALGRHTPLFGVLYDHMPGFDRFRCPAKFTFEAVLFLAMLAAVGLDRLLRVSHAGARPALAALVGGTVLAIGGAAIYVAVSPAHPAGWWQNVLYAIRETHESAHGAEVFDNPAFTHQAGAFAANGMFVAAGTLAALAALARAGRRWRPAAGLIALLAVAEVFVYARMSRVTYDLPSSRLNEVRQFLDSNPGDYRILNMRNYNESMAMGAYDLWGYDPGVPSRYAEFIAFTQGRNPDQADQYLRFRGAHKLHKMLRLKFILTSEYVVENPDPMPRLNLLSDCQVLPNRDQVLAAMNDPAFDPARTVILEKPPRIAPGRPPAGTARIVDSSTDHLTVAADLDSPAILLVTDGWSRGWRAVPLSGSSQREYDVVPADYVLLAVPLAAGHHEFRLEYLPREYLIGKWISILSLIACLAWAGGMAWTHLARRGRMHPLGPPQAAPGRSEAQGDVSRK